MIMSIRGKAIVAMRLYLNCKLQLFAGNLPRLSWLKQPLFPASSGIATTTALFDIKSTLFSTDDVCRCYFDRSISMTLLYASSCFLMQKGKNSFYCDFNAIRHLIFYSKKYCEQNNYFLTSALFCLLATAMFCGWAVQRYRIPVCQ